MDSKEAACLLLQAHTSLPYSRLGRSTDHETNNNLRATILTFQLPMQLVEFFLPISNYLLMFGFSLHLQNPSTTVTSH